MDPLEVGDREPVHWSLTEQWQSMLDEGQQRTHQEH